MGASLHILRQRTCFLSGVSKLLLVFLFLFVSLSDGNGFLSHKILLLYPTLFFFSVARFFPFARPSVCILCVLRSYSIFPRNAYPVVDSIFSCSRFSRSLPQSKTLALPFCDCQSKQIRKTTATTNCARRLTALVFRSIAIQII